jgi:hypothetical protein
MTPFDPHPANFDPNAFPAVSRIGAFLLSAVVVAVLLLEAASVSAIV